MQFQLFKISGLEELFNEVKNELTKELIDQNKASSPFQRSEFYEIITSDLMSLITYSKFEVNSLCLVGFDIYVRYGLFRLGPTKRYSISSVD